MSNSKQLNKNDIIVELTERLENTKGFHLMCYTNLGIVEYEVAEAIVNYFFEIPVYIDWREESSLDHYYWACIYWIACHWCLICLKEHIESNLNNTYSKIKKVRTAKCTNNAFALGVDKFAYSDFLLLETEQEDFFVYPNITNMANEIGNYNFKKEFLNWYIDSKNIADIKLNIKSLETQQIAQTTVGKVGKAIQQLL